MTKFIHGEDQDLKLHSALCAERYESLEKNYLQLDARIGKLELKIDEVMEEITKNKNDLSRIIIGGITTLTASILGLITTILLKF